MSAMSHASTLSQGEGMLSPSKSLLQHEDIKASTPPSPSMQARRKLVLDNDVVRGYEKPYRRGQHGYSNAADMPQWQAPGGFDQEREKQLQSAMDLPSSVLIVQGLRRLMNSDEPLFDVMGGEQKRRLQEEFLTEVGISNSKHVRADDQATIFPPSPPLTPKPSRAQPIKSRNVNARQFCECGRPYCV